MQWYNQILAIESRWLIDNGVMSQANYKQLSARKNIVVVRNACPGTPALVSFESLPDRFKQKVLEIVPDVYDVAARNEVEEHIEHSSEASSYFENYLTGAKNYLSSEKVREYYANAIIFDAIKRLISERKGKHASLGHGHGTTRYWDRISECVHGLDRSKYPHSLPVNARSLENKYKKYIDEGYESLIHKAYKTQNSGAAKIANDSQRSAMAVLISDPRNLDNEQVADIYNALAEQMKWEKICAATVGVWRKKLDDIVFARRHGLTAYRNEKSMQVKRNAPEYPLQYWTLDGWDVELMYQATNDKGITTYHNRLTMVVVLDTCLKYPIGYAIGTHETPELIKEALRNAEKHTEELFGCMYRTAQIQSDRYAIKKMTPTYANIAKHVTPAAVKNAKSKVIEPWFKYFNKKYCQLEKNWSGFGVTSDKELQPNSEYLNRQRHDFPNCEENIKQIVKFLETERGRLREKYIKRFKDMPSERRMELSYKDYLMTFGSTTGHRNLLQAGGVRISINGMKYDYDCFDPDFRRHASVRWEIRFDPDNKKIVLAVNEDETLRFLLEEKYVQPMALADRKEGDAEQLQRILDFNKRQEQRIADEMSGYMETASQLLSSNKALDTLRKLMITDSGGQHKDRRNSERLAIEAHQVMATTVDNYYEDY